MGLLTKDKILPCIKYLCFLTLFSAMMGCGNGKLHEQESYYPDGKVHEKWHEDRSGLKQGIAITYYEKGQKQTEAHFVNGYLDGQFTMWYRNGEPLCSGVYKKGEPWSGELVSVDELNQRVKFKKYKDGNLIVD